jgi:hypothetical protein
MVAGHMEQLLDILARRAGEEFIAAGRTADPEGRRRHRHRAENYANMLDRIRTIARRQAVPLPAGDNIAARQRADA